MLLPGPQTKFRPRVTCPVRRKAAGKAEPTLTASRGSDHHTQARPDPGTGKSGAGDSWGRESVASPGGRGEVVVPGRGGGAKGAALGEAFAAQVFWDCETGSRERRKEPGEEKKP